MNIMTLFDSISHQRHIAAIRQGLLLNMPLAVLGSFMIMLNNISFIWYRQLMTSWFGPKWAVLWQTIVNASLNIMSILLVLSTSYFLAEKHDQVKSGQVHPLMVALVSLTCLIALIQPFAHEGTSGLPFAWTGVDGIFLAVVAAIVSAELFLRLCSLQGITIRLFGDVADPVLSQSLAGVLPLAATVAIFALIKFAAAEAYIIDIPQYMYVQVEGWFQTGHSPLGKLVLFNLLVHILWFFGLHGNHVMEPVLQHIHLAGVQAAAAFGDTGGQSGEMLTKTFLDVFVLLGGSGSTICLMLALFVVSRRGNMAWLARLSIMPAIFNINELLTFGLPIVLNPIFLIPFLLVPLVLTCLSYAAIRLGMVSVVTQSVHWTTPALISGYIATHSWSGVGLQLVNIVIGAIIYMPFVMINEKQKTREIKHAFAVFMDEIRIVNPQLQNQLLTRHDSVGTLARVLAHDLKNALANEELYLEYQPQVNRYNRVIGVEALLRWSHKLYGRVPPPLIVAVAEEAGLIRDVGRWVVNSACRQLSGWKSGQIEGIRMSVNVSALQLQYEFLADDLLEAIRNSSLKPQDLEVEITENIALNNETRTSHNLGRMRKAGIRIAIDDFGMGHTSLRYIKQFPVDTLKIDRILSRDVVRDRNCQEIITSIVSLCTSLNVETIVEYVETEEQRDILKKLGCMHYQGYYYSPPLSPAQAVNYILRLNRPDSNEAAACTTGDRGHQE